MAKSRGRNARPPAKNRPAKTAARARDTEETPGRAGRPSAKDAAERAVAKPAGKKADATTRADDGAAAKPKPASARPRPAPTKRTTPPASARYTPPIPKEEKVSPMWVPILMFGCLGLGMLIIILNYVNVLPGPDPSNVYLMIGLALITIGFITATKFH